LPELTADLDRAREALVRGSWAEAYEGLRALDTATTQLLLALQRSGRVLRFEGIPPQVAGLWRLAGLADQLG